MSVKGKYSYGVIQYQEIYSLHGLKQLIKSPTRITENKSSLLDVLTNSLEKVPQSLFRCGIYLTLPYLTLPYQSGMVDIAVSDH